ncbi:hypothetical protein P280DRAFT_62036 [Massarina eburnea CBS 473.64]|uniref:Uncharacterized protein n=1 Tax=Massarina eburnea CBS 473.64 TaxID=1395130 RepID=A0A6A6RWE7_9PLEO|nr:hypothetical protein P280DRAFT_62036 [Massarina eburnea CBS 473.64]
MRQRCNRINIDIHIGGGYNVAVCSLLAGLHAYHLMCRVHERYSFGERGFPSGAYDDDGESGEMYNLPLSDEDDIYTNLDAIIARDPATVERDELSEEGNGNGNGNGGGHSEGMIPNDNVSIIDPTTGIRFHDFSLERDEGGARNTRFGTTGADEESQRSSAGTMKRAARSRRESASKEEMGWSLLACLIP